MFYGFPELMIHSLNAFKLLVHSGEYEKAFWGMVAGCTLIFGILLGMYLNKSGAVDFSPKADQTQETTQTDQTAGEIEKEGELTSLLQETQGNYAAAMKALEEEQTESPQQPDGSALLFGSHLDEVLRHLICFFLFAFFFFILVKLYKIID